MDYPAAKSFKQLTISVEKLPASMGRQEAIDQYAAERARLLFGCYRTGDANDPETYVAAITAVLSRYPREVITSVTHPVSGLPSKLGWLPKVSEVHDACEAAVLPIAAHEARQRRIAEQMELRRQEDEATAQRPSYSQLRAKYGDDWGLDNSKQVPRSGWTDHTRAARDQRSILAEYAKLGVEPRYTSMGDLISPSLLWQAVGEEGIKRRQHDDSITAPAQEAALPSGS